ncbi:LOW QUALITY PROTEIN: unconventional prefoldin RPB5 interactor 1 [Bufo bufo]|uniref:LOW QUALITY PROTEIN: unconventional prefoldin RPB5 interactor 1 n=1 Tax=Bufo bufo TaxID=8384 RepID=UPI001ABDBF1C|nr:LOW QUALITY PROTEIN: unconventional prefoldin RPB5 interactor 1 [Bufo bufo]
MDEMRDEGRQRLNTQEVTRLQEEQSKVVSGCEEKVQHWKKVEQDYDALQERLGTLPDKLSYDIMVPFGPLAFMPGRLVQTNEITVLLGDNWFAKCSAKQAMSLVDHRKKHVREALDGYQQARKNFESRVEFTKDLQRMNNESGEFFDIKEEVNTDTVCTKGKHRTAHKPHSKPKAADSSKVDFREGESKDGFIDNAELWARLEELEKQEEMRGELEQNKTNEEDKENLKTDLNVDGDYRAQGSRAKSESTQNRPYVNSSILSHHSDEEEDLGSGKNPVATIRFSHMVEPKRVRINTGKNTTLKYSEKKEEAKRKRKNSNGNGHSAPELPVIKTPADIYRVFVDVVNGEYVPRKSIMKSRSRENSVCSDNSDHSSHEFEERRSFIRNVSLEDNTFSDHSEEDDRGHKKASPLSGPLEPFSGMVIEKSLSCISVPVTGIAHPSLPTIQERKSEEVTSEVVEEAPKRVSKFKAARIQQNK